MAQSYSYIRLSTYLRMTEAEQNESFKYTFILSELRSSLVGNKLWDGMIRVHIITHKDEYYKK